MKTIFFTLFLILIGRFGLAQPSQNIDPELHQLPIDSEEERIDETSYMHLMDEFSNPIDINHCDENLLVALNLLTKQEIDEFLNYRNNFGPFLSIYELQAIPEWTLQTINKVCPFLTFTPLKKSNNLFKRFQANENHFLLYKTDFKILKIDGGNAISPMRHTLRYKNAKPNDFSVGIVLENDPGEKFKFDPKNYQYGFDFTSLHVAVFNKGILKSLLVGDYNLQFGEGLVVGGGFSFGKGQEPIRAIKKGRKGVIPYSSVVEAGFLRGGALSLRMLSFLDLTLFYSNVPRDGRAIHQDGIKTITSFDSDGLHVSPSSNANRAQVIEQNVGGNISILLKKKLNLGNTITYAFYNNKIQEEDRIYNRLDFKGYGLVNVGFNFSHCLKNINTFGEYAITNTGGKAMYVGSIISFSKYVDWSLNYRNYNSSYTSFHANGFSTSGEVTNEKGIYHGLSLQLSSKWYTYYYFDSYSSHWLTYQRDGPSRNEEYFFKILFKPSKKSSFYYFIKHKNFERNQADNFTPLDYLVQTKKITNSLHFESCKGKFDFRSRIQWSMYQQSNNPTKGFLIAQDFSYKLQSVKFHFRYSLFDTDDYDNRQYIYEKDVLYAVAIPNYYNKGIRYVLMTQYKCGKHLDLWIRWASTKKYEFNTIQGNTGPTFYEVKAQLLYSFK